MDWLHHFFSTQGFMPHGMCLQWQPAILWGQVISDAVIALSYFLIPVALIYIVLKRKDLKFKLIFWLFGAFIVFCGITHFVSIITFWNPIYGWQAIAKIATAIVSLLTAIIIWPLVPKILAIPSIAEYKEKLERLGDTEIKLRDTQSRTDLLLESTTEGIMGIDTGGMLMFINHAALRMLGYESQEELSKTKLHDLILYAYPDGSGYPIDQCNMYASFRDGQVRHIDDEVLWRKDKKSFWVEYSSTPILVNNIISGAVVVFRDITDRKVREQYENDLLSTVQKSNLALSEFTYIASHDLKEPVRGINTYTQLLLKDCGKNISDKGKQHLKSLGDLAMKITSQVDAIQAYTRISMTMPSIHEVSLVSLCNEQVDKLQIFLKKNGAVVHIDPLLSDAPCDRSLLGEAISCLIKNGIIFNNNLRKIIRIYSDEDNDYVYLHIKDNGIGIDAAYHKQIFRIFRKLHSGSTYDSGIGVGLSLVKKIIDLHSGKIELRSENDAGTEVVLALPKLGDALHEELQ